MTKVMCPQPLSQKKKKKKKKKKTYIYHTRFDIGLNCEFLLIVNSCVVPSTVLYKFGPLSDGNDRRRKKAHLRFMHT